MTARELRRCWLAGGLVLLTSTCLALPSLGAKDDPAPLRFVARYSLPGEGSVYTDVRWASRDSVFLSRFAHGVVEMGLGDKLEQRQQPVPPGRMLHPSQTQPPSVASLAASSQFLAVAAPAYNLTWRLRERSASGQVRFEHKRIGIVDDLDLFGDRVVLLGSPLERTGLPDSPYEVGGIAWLGTLSSGLKDLKPVLQDLSGAAFDHFWACSGIPVGAVRFLKNGSFVVVPGYQPGAHLFDAKGKLIRSWSSLEIGLTTGCTGLPQEEGNKIVATTESVFNWLNERRALEDILSLPEGPGLIVRSRGRDGKYHWHLRLLSLKGRPAAYSLPFETPIPYMRVHADLQAGKAVFLLASRRLRNTDQADLAGEIFVAEVSTAKGKTL